MRMAINEAQVVLKKGADTPLQNMNGRALHDRRTKENVQPYASDFRDAMVELELALTAASRLTGEEFTRAKLRTLLFSQCLELYPSLSATTGSGTGMRVRRARRRLREKQERG
eukprot:gnl/TRDRNA2_/TRDRNA2_62743_c0_seq1.p2 gnl/TRDRNA2_/TRDRNA2_62743_c0~~gnl/TRDRNA2_/TRDRNA2_62743_c0_seq1.p2  ORF type:complete len:113 (-),score=17.43 gnl/TRDRNA2_/TRDRNA2_62743_c0_seq1:158-496(-)